MQATELESMVNLVHALSNDDAGLSPDSLRCACRICKLEARATIIKFFPAVQIQPRQVTSCYPCHPRVQWGRLTGQPVLSAQVPFETVRQGVAPLFGSKSCSGCIMDSVASCSRRPKMLHTTA